MRALIVIKMYRSAIGRQLFWCHIRRPYGEDQKDDLYLNKQYAAMLFQIIYFFLNVYWNGIYKKVCMLATIAITVGIKIMYDFLINALRCDE